MVDMDKSKEWARIRADMVIDGIYHNRARVVVMDQAMVLDPAMACPICKGNLMVAGPLKEDTGGPNMWVKLTCSCPGYVGTSMKVDRP